MLEAEDWSRGRLSVCRKLIVAWVGGWSSTKLETDGRVAQAQVETSSS